QASTRKRAPPGLKASPPPGAPAHGKRSSISSACSPNQPMPAVRIFANDRAAAEFNHQLETALSEHQTIGEPFMKKLSALLLLLALVLLSTLATPQASMNTNAIKAPPVALAERLGFKATDKLLIINVDDIGNSHAAN